AAAAAATHSVTQKACQTPTGPSAAQSAQDAGIMTTTYRSSEMTSELPPLPSPSSAPDAATDTDETRNPRLMIRSAAAPAATVSGFWVNSAISGPAKAQHSAVPAAMMPAQSARVVR